MKLLKNTHFCKITCFCMQSSAKYASLWRKDLSGAGGAGRPGPGHIRSFSSASSAAAISSASELLPSSSSLLDSLLDSLAASSSFSFLLWPLRRRGSTTGETPATDRHVAGAARPHLHPHMPGTAQLRGQQGTGSPDPKAPTPRSRHSGIHTGAATGWACIWRRGVSGGQERNTCQISDSQAGFCSSPGDCRQQWAEVHGLLGLAVWGSPQQGGSGTAPRLQGQAVSEQGLGATQEPRAIARQGEGEAARRSGFLLRCLHVAPPPLPAAALVHSLLCQIGCDCFPPTQGCSPLPMAPQLSQQSGASVNKSSTSTRHHQGWASSRGEGDMATMALLWDSPPGAVAEAPLERAQATSSTQHIQQSPRKTWEHASPHFKQRRHLKNLTPPAFGLTPRKRNSETRKHSPPAPGGQGRDPHLREAQTCRWWGARPSTVSFVLHRGPTSVLSCRALPASGSQALKPS